MRLASSVMPGGCGNTRHDLGVRVVQAADARLGGTAEEGVHNVGGIVIVHRPCGDEGVHLAGLAQVEPG